MDTPETLEDIPAEFTVTLRKPVKLPSDATLEALQLREPTGAEMDEVDRLEGRLSTMTLISRVSGVPLQTVKQIGVGDLNRAEAYLLRFIRGGRGTGGAS